MGDGELGPVIAVGDSSGNVKGYVGNADCPTDITKTAKSMLQKQLAEQVC